MTEEIIRQVPNLAVMAVIVIACFRHLEKVSARGQLMAQHCHDVQRDATEAMRETAKAMGENSNVLREVSVLLRAMNGKEHKP